MPTLSRITVYPVKSLDGVDFEQADVLPCGALEHDRRWRLVDLDGRVLNAKRSPLFSPIRADFDLEQRIVVLWAEPTNSELPRADLDRLAGLGRERFPLVPGPGGPCGWLSEALGVSVLLEERADGGFPDDPEAPGPTLVSCGTLLEVGRWFGLDRGEARRRFRANLEVEGCDAFWEDTLASPARSGLPSLLELPPDMPSDPYAGLPPLPPRPFGVGAVWFEAVNVCRRCVVPTRDSRTGAVNPVFRDAFAARRSRSLRPDVDASDWRTLYRLAINTRGAGRGGTIRRGDPVQTSRSVVQPD